MSTITTPAPPEGGVLLTPADLAARWSVSVGTLANDRCAGRGLRYVKVNGSRIRYRLADVLEHEAAHLIEVAA
jgi:hypothetical protein